jgi:hypothetical protein
MIPYDDSKKIYNDLVKDKVMIWIVRIVGIALTISLIINIIWFFYDGHNGKHVKMIYGLFETNIPKEHPDTVPKIVVVHKIDTIYKPIYKTIYLKRDSAARKTNNTHIDKADKVEIH